MDPLDIFPSGFWLAVAALFGALWGSFANVFIWRWPAGLSVVRPRSHCPSCGTPVAAYDNVPVLSYFLLRGRCRSCAGTISFRYPVVEASLAALSAAVWSDTVLAAGSLELVTVANYLVSFLLCWALVVVAFVDLDTQLVPTGLTNAVAVVGLAAHLTLPGGRPTDAAIGAVVGFGSVLALSHAYRLVRGQAGMGTGDGYLLAAVGAHLGWQGVLFTLAAGALQFLVVHVVVLAGTRREGPGPVPLSRRPAPLGPFLSAGALEFFVLGDRARGLFDLPF